MKKVILFSVLVIGYFLFPPEISNAASIGDVNTTQELHQELKDAKIIYLDKDGLIAVPDDLSSLGVNQDLAEKYIDMINIANDQIQDGIFSMDKELNVKPFTAEEIADKVYENDQKDKNNNNNKRSVQAAAANPKLNVVSLVEKNRKELIKIHDIQATVNPSSAYTFSVGWWVGKVTVNGDWDYKVVSGYSPWNKSFSMTLYNGVVQTHNSKWLGNYNYGYTGQFLFPLNILHKGGDAVSYALNYKPDSQAAKDTIEWGFSDAYYFK